MPQQLSRVQLLEEIQKISLVCVDLNLFLDTHPDCEEALRDFNRANKFYRQLVNEYQVTYGPLLGFGQMSTMEQNYNWIKGPWPWERQNRGESL